MKWKPLNGAPVKALRVFNTLPTWEALISKVHKVTTTAALFARYCFIRALAEDPTFDLKVHVEKEIFFTESWRHSSINTEELLPLMKLEQSDKQLNITYRISSTIINTRKKQSHGCNPIYFSTQDQPSVHVIWTTFKHVCQHTEPKQSTLSYVSIVFDDNYGIVRPLKTSNQIFGDSFETSLISNTR